jgi:hypothetical protein
MAGGNKPPELDALNGVPASARSGCGIDRANLLQSDSPAAMIEAVAKIVA